jgi:hypothetical protein
MPPRAEPHLPHAEPRTPHQSFDVPPVPLTPQQAEFFRCEAPLALFCGGVGSGKTFAGACWLRKMARRFPNALGFVAANTYLQLHKSTLPCLLWLLKEHGPAFVHGRRPDASWDPPVESRYHDHENVLTLANGAQILTFSLENHDALRGLELGYAWIDETRDTRLEAFEVLLERLRGKMDGPLPSPPAGEGRDEQRESGMRGRALTPGSLRSSRPSPVEGRGHPNPLRITTTPNGFDWLYERFKDPARRWPGAVLIRASSYDNPHLRGDYARELEARLGKDLAQQEIYAEFLEVHKGRAYAFRRDRHERDDVEYDPARPLILAHDFNRDPLCAVVLQVDREQRRAWVLDEIVIPGCGLTQYSANEFIRRYGQPNGCHSSSVTCPSSWVMGHSERGSGGRRQMTSDQGPRTEVRLTGDRTGNQGGTACSNTDFDVLKQSLRPHFDVRFSEGKANPREVDRVNEVNALLEPALGLPRLFVHKRCERLIADLEKVAFIPGTQELDKDSNRALTHLSDALGYAIHEFLPVKKGRASGYGYD